MSGTNAEAGIDWSAGRVLPAFQTPTHLAVYDLRATPFDIKVSIATLVGLINRPLPRVYLYANTNDDFWLEHVLSPLVPHTISPLRGIDILKELLTTYRELVRGYILYDPDMPDSINVATTLAGQRDAVIVSPDLARQLLDALPRLPILQDLRKLTVQWPTRLHAYRWAQQNALAGASKRMIAGLDPQKTVGIRSYLVANRAFVHWLDPRNVLPDPRLGLLSERALLRQLFDALSPGAAHMGWFVNEGIGVMQASQHAIMAYASDFSTNLEVWSGVPLPEPLPEQAAEQQELPALDPHKVYVSFTFSEGDNLQYIQAHMLDLWRDPARGSIPIGWTTSPALIHAAPALASYYARTATPNDDLIAGPSGVGYMYPSFWPADAYPTYLKTSGELMQQMNLSLLAILDSNVFQSVPLTIRAFTMGAGMALINKTHQQSYVEGLSAYGLKGLLSGGGQDHASWSHIADVPVFQNVGIAGSVNQAVEMIQKAAATTQQRPFFINLYSLAWQLSPTKLVQVRDALGSAYEVVTPHMLLRLLQKNE